MSYGLPYIPAVQEAQAAGDMRLAANAFDSDAESGHTRPEVDTTKQPVCREERVEGHQGNQGKNKKAKQNAP